jgi:hypothetical protein
VSEDCSAALKYCDTLPSSAINENRLVRKRTGVSSSKPQALVKAPESSDKKRMPASAPPEVRPQA